MRLDDPRLGFASELIAFWRSLLEPGSPVPRRERLEPGRLGRLFGSLVVIECRDPARPWFRLVGPEVRARFGRDLSGSDARTMASAALQDDLRQRLQDMTATPCGCYFVLKHERTTGDLDIDGLALPLRRGRSLAATQIVVASVVRPVAAVRGVDPSPLGICWHLVWPVDLGLGVPPWVTVHPDPGPPPPADPGGGLDVRGRGAISTQ